MKTSGKYKKSKKEQITRKSVINDTLPKKKGQGSAEIDMVDTVDYQEKVEEIFGYIKQGMRSQEIFAMLNVDDPSITESRFVKMLGYAFDFAKNAMHKDRDYVFQLHMARYEDIYQKLMEEVDGFVRPTTQEEWARWRTVVTKYQQAIAALGHKENLLGLHDKKVVLEFNDHQAVVINNSDKTSGEGIAGYNLSNITLDEQIELLSYIKEARTVPIEGIQRIVIKRTLIELNPETGERGPLQNVLNIDNIQEVKFEEMPANVISKMDNIPELIEEKEEIKGNVRNFVPEGIEKKGVEDIVAAQRKAVMEKFKKQLKGK